MDTQLSLSNPATIRAYFEKVRQLARSGNSFPVNLDEVWPLVYAEKGVAVRSLKKNFFEGEDFEVIDRNVKNLSGGRPELDYRLSLPCLEYFITRKVRAVFEVYRSVFHQALDTAENQLRPEQQQLLIFTERPKQISNSKEVNSYNFSQGGKEQAVAYNRMNCFLHTVDTLPPKGREILWLPP